MISRLLAAAGLIAAIVAGYFLVDRARQSGVAPQAERPAKEDPGFVARNAEIIETGPDGRPVYTLRASTIRQPPNEQTVLLESVNLELRDEEGNLWTAQAQRGHILRDAARINLEGSVHVVGKLRDAPNPLNFTTEQVAFDTREEVVRTESPVTLDWGGRKLQARGLVASLKDHRVQLESQVHGIFPP